MQREGERKENSFLSLYHITVVIDEVKCDFTGQFVLKRKNNVMSVNVRVKRGIANQIIRIDERIK